MKKLFAGIIAVLALAPVVASAAYTSGDYINFAGNEDDWNAFQTNEDEYLNRTGNGTIYIGESDKKDEHNNKYLRVINLFGYSSDAFANTEQDPVVDTTVGSPYMTLVGNVRESVKSPYGYASTAAGVDVDVATLEDLTAVFGVSSLNDTVELTGDVKTFFGEMFTVIPKDVIYVGTKTAVPNSTTNIYALKVEKTNNEITSIKLVSVNKAGEGSQYGHLLLPVVLMNEAYVCEAGTEETYSCYECPTTGDQTEYTWKKDGSQDAACKKIDTITTKAKCAKNSKTGVDNYLIPSAIILGVCAIVLTVVKRKDAFKAI